MTKDATDEKRQRKFGNDVDENKVLKIVHFERKLMKKFKRLL